RVAAVEVPALPRAWRRVRRWEDLVAEGGETTEDAIRPGQRGVVKGAEEMPHGAVILRTAMDHLRILRLPVDIQQDCPLAVLPAEFVYEAADRAVVSLIDSLRRVIFECIRRRPVSIDEAPVEAGLHVVRP